MRHRAILGFEKVAASPLFTRVSGKSHTLPRSGSRVRISFPAPISLPWRPSPISKIVHGSCFGVVLCLLLSLPLSACAADSFPIEVNGHDLSITSPLKEPGNIVLGGGGHHISHSGGVSNGYYNTAFGHLSFEDLTIGFDNTALGYMAMNATTEGFSNTGLGYSALRELTTGRHNVAVGRWAMRHATGAYNNTALGHATLSFLTTGYANMAVGDRAGEYVEGGTHNNLLGAFAGRNLTQGRRNILIGFQAGYYTTTGSGNILIGHNIWTPLPTTNDFLSIGNLIYGVGLKSHTEPSSGSVGIGTPEPTATLDVAGDIKARAFILPEHELAPCQPGQVEWSEDSLLVCTSEGWKRAVLEPLS